MKLRQMGYALLLTLPLAACKGKGAAPAEDAEIVAAVPASKAASPAGKYPAKSGIIEWKTDLMGDMTSILYFDDDGARQASYTTTKVSLFGTTSITRSVEISADGWKIKYDPDAKTGVRYRMNGGALGGMPKFPDAKELAQMKAGKPRFPASKNFPPVPSWGERRRASPWTRWG